MADDQRAIDEAYGVQHIDEAYVRSLADPLIRHMSEPPHDPLTVLAFTCRAVLFEAWEMIEVGRIGLKQAKWGDSPFAHTQHGQVYAATKVVRQIADALRLFHPGPLFTPGERVLASRARLGLTQPRLAELAHCGRSHLSHIERGTRPLTKQMATGLARHLGVTAQYLLTGEDT